MASTLKHLRSSTANKRPTASGLVDGQLAINTASGTPALFFKDSNGGVVKVGPAHVGSAAPNAVPAGSAGNSLGELWVDNSLTTPGLNYYTGSAFVNLTPSGTTTTIGLVELATPAETQTGTDAVRAVTPSGLQSKVSDSTSTTSSTTIASSTAVKSAYDLANAALPKAGGTVTGELLIGTTGSLVFEGSSDDSFETTIAVVDPTGDRTITFPNVTGTVVTTGDSGTVTSTMIANDTIVNADINSAAAIAYSKLALSSGIVNTDISASAAIVDTKLATISTANKVSISALDIDGATDIGGALEGGDLFIVDDGAGGTNRKAPAFRMAQLTYSGVTGDITIASGGTSAIGAGVIVNADVNASAAIAGTKISPDFGSQTITTTGVVSAALGAAATPSITFTGDLNTGIYSPGADQVAISTNGAERVEFGASEVVFNDSGANYDFRVEGDTNANLLFVDASADAVGIGTGSPAYNIHGTGYLGLGTQASSGAGAGVHMIPSSTVTNWFVGANFVNAGTFQIIPSTTGGGSTFTTPALTIDSSSRVGIGTSTPSHTLTVAGNIGSSGRGNTFGFALPDWRIYNSSSGNALVIDNYTTEALRVDSSNRLLVGTSSGSDNNALLKVQGNVGGTTGAGWIDIRRGLTTPGSGGQLGLLSFSDASGNLYAGIEGYTDAATGTNDYPGRLVFFTTADGASSPTERMRIRSTGQVWINQTGNISGTGDSVPFQVTGNGADYAAAIANGNASPYGLYLLHGTDINNNTNTFLFCQGSAAQRAAIRTNGGFANYQANDVNLSDRNAKKDITPAAGTWDCIKEWEIVNYRYKDQPDDADLNLGVIAQQVAESCPEVITVFEEAKDNQPEKLGVKEQQMYWMAIKALQEAQVRIEALEAKVAALESA